MVTMTITHTLHTTVLAIIKTTKRLRVKNEKCRLRLYRKCWKGVCTIPEMYHNIKDDEGNNKRIPLPNCACSMIRRLYPSQSGRYTGFKLN